MAKINLGRVLLGGVIAGVVMDAFEAVMNGVILAPQWAEIMKSLGRPDFAPIAVVWFNIVGLITGIAAVWTYAAIRPRFGSGPRTALIAAALTWVTAKAVVVAYPVISGVYPLQPMALMLGLQIIEIGAATLAGAWFYQESAD